MMSNTKFQCTLLLISLFLSFFCKDKVVEKKLWCWTHRWPGNKGFRRISHEVDFLWSQFFVTLNIFTVLEIKLHEAQSIKNLHSSKQMKCFTDFTDTYSFWPGWCCLPSVMRYILSPKFNFFLFFTIFFLNLP